MLGNTEDVGPKTLRIMKVTLAATCLTLVICLLSVVGYHSLKERIERIEAIVQSDPSGLSRTPPASGK